MDRRHSVKFAGRTTPQRLAIMVFNLKTLLAFVVFASLIANIDHVTARDSRLAHHQLMARRVGSQTSHDNMKWDHPSSSKHHASSHGSHHSHSSSKHHTSSHGSHHSQSSSSHAGHTGGAGHKDDDDLIVKTHEGKVRGTFNHTSEVYSWLGVPFGADTSGSNRFLAPKPAHKYQGIRDATHYGKSCPQHGSPESTAAVGLFGLSPKVFDQKTQSEDCLNVNIQIGKKAWKKHRKSKGHYKVPVWLNFYGGSYEWGSNNLEMYKADGIVNQDEVVVVSANSRNWIFGSPLAPQLHPDRNHDNDDYTGANPTLKDIDLAIEWVHKNIARFGGDPDRITMGGTSTGACSIDNWAFVHYNKPSANRIKGLILQSGSMTSLGRYFLADNDDKFTSRKSGWNKVANHVGCGTSNDEKQFRCMQRKPWKSLMSASFKTNAKFTLAIDNVTTFNNYFERLEERRFVDIPMLIGNNKDEGNAFLMHQAELTQFVGPIITSEVWVCPAGVQADIRSKGSAPTWRYRFSPSFYIPNTPKQYKELLTYHGSDTPYAWNSWRPLSFIQVDDVSKDPGPLVTYPEPTDDNRIRAKIADAYREANVKFVKDPENGLRHFRGGWPEYKKGTWSVGDFGYNNNAEHPFRLANSFEIDGLCPLTNAQVNQNNLKYKPGFQKVRSYLV